VKSFLILLKSDFVYFWKKKIQLITIIIFLFFQIFFLNLNYNFSSQVDETLSEINNNGNVHDYAIFLISNNQSQQDLKSYLLWDLIKEFKKVNQKINIKDARNFIYKDQTKFKFIPFSSKDGGGAEYFNEIDRPLDKNLIKINSETGKIIMKKDEKDKNPGKEHFAFIDVNKNNFPTFFKNNKIVMDLIIGKKKAEENTFIIQKDNITSPDFVYPLFDYFRPIVDKDEEILIWTDIEVFGWEWTKDEILKEESGWHYEFEKDILYPFSSDRDSEIYLVGEFNKKEDINDQIKNIEQILENYKQKNETKEKKTNLFLSDYFINFYDPFLKTNEKEDINANLKFFNSIIESRMSVMPKLINITKIILSTFTFIIFLLNLLLLTIVFSKRFQQKKKIINLFRLFGYRWMKIIFSNFFFPLLILLILLVLNSFISLFFSSLIIRNLTKTFFLFPLKFFYFKFSNFIFVFLLMISFLFFVIYLNLSIKFGKKHLKDFFMKVGREF
jgi:hypothetical protein